MRGNPTWIGRAYLDKWIQLPSMKRLWENLRRENMKSSTFRTYMKNVKSVINFAGYADPEQFLADFRQDKIPFDELCDRYITAHAHLQNTVVRKRVLRTKKWLRANLDLKNGEGAKLNLETITMPRGNQKRGASDAAPTRRDLKEMLAHMKNTRDKAIMLVAASSGLRPETLLSLNVGDVEFTFDVRRDLKTEKVEDIGKINITPGPGRKVKSAYYTHITPEAKEKLLKYLDERRRVGETINEESSLWVTHFDLLPDVKKNKRPINRLSYDTFSLQWRRILKRAQKDTKSYAEGGSWFWHKFHLKTLRKFFRTEVTNARCIEDLKYFWMGQPGGVHRPEYYKDHLDVSVDEYRRLKDFLSVEKPLVPVEKEDLEQLEKKHVEEKKELQDRLAKMEKRIQDSRSDGIIVLKTMQKLQELMSIGGKELKEFDAAKYMEDLRRERERELKKRKIAMAEYVKKHPLPEKPSVEDLEQHHRGFEEYYKKKSSAGSAEESSD